MSVCEKELGVPSLIDPEDVGLEVLSMITALNEWHVKLEYPNGLPGMTYAIGALYVHISYFFTVRSLLSLSLSLSRSLIIHSASPMRRPLSVFDAPGRSTTPSRAPLGNTPNPSLTHTSSAPSLPPATSASAQQVCCSFHCALFLYLYRQNLSLSFARVPCLTSTLPTLLLFFPCLIRSFLGDDAHSARVRSARGLFGGEATRKGDGAAESHGTAWYRCRMCSHKRRRKPQPLVNDALLTFAQTEGKWRTHRRLIERPRQSSSACAPSAPQGHLPLPFLAHCFCCFCCLPFLLPTDDCR